MKMFHKSLKGFTLVEIMIVVAIIGILVAIAVPGFVKARAQSRAKACQENLAKIDGAKEQYAMEKNLAEGGTIPDGDLWANGTYLKREPSCPSSGNYTVGAVGTDPTCTIGETKGHDLQAIGTASDETAA